ncbi:hypothetical protein MaudMau93_005711 [Microsporum audouinii]
MDQLDNNIQGNSSDEVYNFDTSNGDTPLNLSQEEIDFLLSEWEYRGMAGNELPPLGMLDSGQLPIPSDLLDPAIQDELLTEANSYGVPDLVFDKEEERLVEKLSVAVKELQESVQCLKEENQALRRYIEKLQPFLSYVGDAVTRWLG